MPIVGALLIILGAANLVLPSIGPTFGFGMGPDPAWVLTDARLWRHVVPDVAIIAGGVMLLPRMRASRVHGGGRLGLAPVVARTGAADRHAGNVLAEQMCDRLEV